MTRFWTTVSAAALAGALGACASTPNYPIAGEQPSPRTNPPSQAYAPPPAAPSAPEESGPVAAPSQPVQSRPLGELPPAAPPAQGPAYVTPSTPPAEARPAAPPAFEPAEAPTPAPRYVAPPRPQGMGKVVNTGKAPIKVAKGDTLNSISRKSGIPIETLAKDNGLKSPYRLHPGQSIKLPAKRYYSVLAGDTLYAVARRFGMQAADLAEFNEVTLGTAIHAGDRVYIPLDAKDHGPPPIPRPVLVPAPRPRRAPPPAYQPPFQSAPPQAAAPEAAPLATSPAGRPSVPAPQPYRPPVASPAPNPTPYRPPTADNGSLADAQIAAAGRGRFVWPLRGDILSSYGPTGGGQRNDGVNIAAPAGTPVHAAGSGEVVYSGNQVPGFGNLVLIKHEGGWVTAYAHLSTLDVKMRQSIAQGQVIGESGQTGSVDSPQLHFEVRYAPSPTDKARPVDPMLVLPR